MCKLTMEQLKDLSSATELYARVRMGQFSEIVWRLLSWDLDTQDFCDRRDDAEDYLLSARKYIYPELYGMGHSYGIGRFKDADLAFDIHQVARVHLGIEREPFSYNELPIIIKEGDDFILQFSDKHADIALKACKFYYDICNGKFEEILTVCKCEQAGIDHTAAMKWLNLAKEKLLIGTEEQAVDILDVYKKIKEEN